MDLVHRPPLCDHTEPSSNREHTCEKVQSEWSAKEGGNESEPASQARKREGVDEQG